MNVNVRRHILTFTITCGSFLVAGCETPQPTPPTRVELIETITFQNEGINTAQAEAIESLKESSP